MFDMLDPQGQGRIAKGDLLRHCLPLIERVECCGPTDNGPRERRGSAFEASTFVFCAHRYTNSKESGVFAARGARLELDKFRFF